MSTCPKRGSMFNEGIWNAQRKTWESSDIPCTMKGDAAHYTAFLLGTPPLQATGCSMQVGQEQGRHEHVNMLEPLYCAYQRLDAVADSFCYHCTVGTASWFLLSLERDVDAVLQNILPFP